MNNQKINNINTQVRHNPFIFGTSKVPIKYRKNKQIYTSAVMGYPSNIKHIPLETLNKDIDICRLAIKLDRYAIQEIPYNVEFLAQLYCENVKSDSEIIRTYNL